ncbi:MAG: VWA domain-containing protein [Planctomycetota bacterium]|nr:MAG: VWA domain-containing protein [Planctomycetota bacterium]
MNFLRPEFLWALPLVALPVVIHLLNRQRYQRVDFSAMEFLRLALKRTRKRLFLEDFLLLLLRTLAVLLLILALAKPGADPGSLLAGRSARAEILLLDASLSMAHRQGGTSAFERALAFGQESLEQLAPERGDRAALIVAGTTAERTAYGDPAEVLSALQEQDQPGNGEAALASALEMALRSADSLAAEGPEEIRISILSDLQLSAWDFEGSEGQAIRRLAEAGHFVQILDTGFRKRQNTAVLELRVDPPELSPGEYGQVRARIRHFGEQARSGLRLSLVVDGVPVHQEVLDLEAGEELDWNHALALADPGPRGLELRLAGDSLPTDDRRCRILPVRPAPRVLLIGEAAAAGEPDGIRESILPFLDLGEGSPVRLEQRLPGRLGSDVLEKVDVVLLADPGPLPPSTLAELATFHSRGGGLFLALGPRTGEADHAEVLEALQVPALAIGPVVRLNDGNAKLAIREAQHPALRLFEDPVWRPLLTEVPFAAFRQIRLPAETPGSLADFQVILDFIQPTGEGAEFGPALVEWEPEGRGRLVAMAASPLPAWNRMVEVPGGTLPLLLDLVAHLTPRPGHPLEVQVGGSLELIWPRAPSEVLLTDPTGTSRHPSSPTALLPGGRAKQRLAETAAIPGAWTAEARLLDPSGEEETLVERIAVVTPAAESDLSPAPTSMVTSLLPEGVSVRRLGEESPDPAAESTAPSGPRDLSGHLYRGVLLLLIAETLLAALLDRRRG